jgi:predicted nucleic acid-binding protein
MSRWFGDTFYFLALLNPKDARHNAAVAFSRTHGRSVVTTDWVLTELADGLAKQRTRRTFTLVYEGLVADPGTTIIKCSPGLWEQGRLLYEARADKDWSLTDCISFVVMEREKIAEALTADHHFEQAGFVALLKPLP